MTEAPFFSSQSSGNDGHHIEIHALDHQKSLASSPPNPSSSSPLASRSSSSHLRLRKAPTVTPKRFTKFFTPRASSTSTRGARQSKAGRQLRDITKNGANRRRQLMPFKEDMSKHLQDDEGSIRPLKRRRTSVHLQSSPPQSSPLKHVEAAGEVSLFALDLEAASPSVSDVDVRPELLESVQPFPEPIRRLRANGGSRRVLERAFGGYDAVFCGYRGAQHGADWRSETANFVSTPTDVHSFRSGTAIPFCTASCHTNSLVALGDEEGSIRLVDTSPESDFTRTHINLRVHHNAVMDLAFSSDDFLLATASGDQTSRIVDMHTQQVLCVLSGHGSSVKQVRFRPNDDNKITTSSRDGTVQIWDLRCAERGSVQSLRVGQRRDLNEDGVPEPSIRYPRHGLKVGPAHRGTKYYGVRAPGTQHSDENVVSITAIEHLRNGREHLLITASELSASIKLWDLRNAGRRDPVPLSSTPLPESHRMTRNFGVSSMVFSGDGARLYTLCKDTTVYAYSTNHLMIGHAPELSSATSRRRTLKEPKASVGPLYAFRHPALTTGSFYVKLALRKAQGDKSELLAVGSGSGSPILIPTDEQYFPAREATAEMLEENDEDEGDDDLPLPLPASRTDVTESPRPIHSLGTALIRGHNKEVTSLCFSHQGGELVTVSDDFTASVARSAQSSLKQYKHKTTHIPSPLSKQFSPCFLHFSTPLLHARPTSFRPANHSLGGAPVALLQTTSPRASHHNISDFTNYGDPLDNWDIINDADWLEAAIALDLDDPAIAAAEQQLPGPHLGFTSCSGPCHESPTDREHRCYSVSDQLGSVVGDIAGAPNWTALANNPTAPWLGQHYDVSNSADPLQHHSLPALANADAITTVVANAAAVIVCHSVTDIPRGRQQAKILVCGFPGCVSTARFDRPHELERHMALHFLGNYPCVQPGCGFTGMRAFKRTDKLRKHEREAHGL
ncbi:hypothetical protein LTS00_017034 [Friedmanniomyces endolithicus]|uniref:C2H2-type domain-containing protein n=1 Tax=Friedmanniomyces endolithicus TaxID=329885 RepID=A0AAN6J1W3_9PEZI|nr:hypothetical protein LTS00_017034 [Friedmanniomyces endolithicus]KAK0310191.1 hypothetical protein LTR82_014873 [Friedmanniomyces endolithicus]